MPAVSTSELARLRSSLEEPWFTEECEIIRPTRVSDSAGGYTDTNVEVGTVMCSRKGPSISTTAEALTAGRPVSAISWVIALPAGTDVRPQDRLVIRGRTYEVEADLDRTIEIARYVVAKELQGQS